MSKTARVLLQTSAHACAYPSVRWEQKLASDVLWSAPSCQPPAECKHGDHLRVQDLQKEEENSRLTLRLYSFTHCKMTSSFWWYSVWLMGRHDQEENFEPDVWGSDSLETYADSRSGPFISDPFPLNFGQLNFLLKTTPKSRQSCVVWLCWDSTESSKEIGVSGLRPACYSSFSILVLQLIKSSGIFPFCWGFWDAS